jgi:hypothetical protein
MQTFLKVKSREKTRFLSDYSWLEIFSSISAWPMFSFSYPLQFAGHCLLGLDIPCDPKFAVREKCDASRLRSECV